MLDNKTKYIRKTITSLMAGAMIVSMAACGQDPSTASTATTSQTTAAGQDTEIPAQEVNEKLRDALPDDIKKAGEITSVNQGAFPPYQIINSDGSLSGVQADIFDALGQLWGVKVKNETVDGLSGALTGISAGRYQLAMGPIGDFKSRQAQNDFVDWVQEYVVFAVPKGNPKHLESIEDTCGMKVSVMAGGSAEKKLREQSTACETAGKQPVEVQSLKDQPSALLAVQSGRADAFFSSRAPLTYYTQHSDGKLELAGLNSSNHFDNLYQGTVTPKGSALTQVVKDSMQALFDNGTYDKIMAKWGLDGNKIDAPGINLAKN